ncbi:hypothetical protein TRAPUB_8578 [Trametes pubescens]|uniref:Uncharacterized protein n=1 Tax=Trametes pubescens TaxID=154538 RepID=A0A1M2W4R9_TRAPU|nr:hypothetical protein TRAPUB_8578 [Trametes pubescens]
MVGSTPGSGPFPTAATAGSPYTPNGCGLLSTPGTSGLYTHFPPTPNAANGTSTFASSQANGLPPIARRADSGKDD